MAHGLRSAVRQRVRTHSLSETKSLLDFRMPPQTLLRRVAHLLATSLWLSCALAPVAIAQIGTASQADLCTPWALRMRTILPGNEVFVVEGRIDGYDTAAETILVNGIHLHVPANVLIDVDGDDLGDLAFAQVFEPSAEAAHTLLGGNVIAEGMLVPSSALCWDREARLVHVEFAEHVLVGPLSGVTPRLGELEILGTRVRLNTDPRFPAELLDLGGQPITFGALTGFEGTTASVEGYFSGGILYALRVETSAWTRALLTDTVLIERARWDPSKLSIEVRGFVSPGPADQPPVALLDVFTSAQPGASCSGAAPAGSVTTVFDLALGVSSFRYRSADGTYPTMPAFACVESILGGSATRAFIVH